MVIAKKIVVALIIVTIIIVITLGIFSWKISRFFPVSIIGNNFSANRQKELNQSVDQRISNSNNSNSDNKNIVIVSPEAREIIKSPLNITGQINGEGWSGYEGQAGTVELRDEKGQKIGSAVLETTTDWMLLPAKFKGILTFNSSQEQNGTLVFRNENPSGMPENEREVILKIIIGKTE